jgi:hypothetical protein
MGLMGRMVIHNGDSPNCIHYDKNDIASIIDAINNEFKHSHDLGLDKTKEVASATKSYLNVNDDWLDTDFYDKRNWTELIPKI